MQTMTIRVTNQTLESVDTAQFATAEEAYQAAVVAGLEIAAQEIRTGSSGTIVQVAVDLPEQNGFLQGAVAVSTARFSGAASEPQTGLSGQ